MTKNGSTGALLKEAYTAPSSPPRPTASPQLTVIQRRGDSPFGMQFLHVPLPQPRAVYHGKIVAKVSTAEPSETSNDSSNGTTKTDWENDEDNWQD